MSTVAHVHAAGYKRRLLDNINGRSRESEMEENMSRRGYGDTAYLRTS